MALSANPSPLLIGAIAVASVLLAVACVAPVLFVLASFVGLAPYDFGLLMIGIPTAGLAVIFAVVARVAIADLLLPHPVLHVTEEGVLDRRVADRPIRWREVTAVTSLLDGRGGIVVELAEPLTTRLEPFRPGTFLFERPDPGLAHIAVRAMTVPAAELEQAILASAAAAGVPTARAATHPRVQRRSIM